MGNTPKLRFIQILVVELGLNAPRTNVTSTSIPFINITLTGVLECKE